MSTGKRKNPNARYRTSCSTCCFSWNSFPDRSNGLSICSRSWKSRNGLTMIRLPTVWNSCWSAWWKKSWLPTDWPHIWIVYLPPCKMPPEHNSYSPDYYTRLSFMLISPVTRIWLSVEPWCSVIVCLRTLIVRSQQKQSPTFGAAGICPSPSGSGITFTNPSRQANDIGDSGVSSTLLWSPSCYSACGTGLVGTMWYTD